MNNLEASCQKLWEKLGLTNEQKIKEHIKTIFAKHDHQSNVIVDLYKLVLPDWDKIEKVEETPEIGKGLWLFICNQFIEFDKIHHPKCMEGGMWFNCGFSCNSELDPWEISFDNCKVRFGEPETANVFFLNRYSHCGVEWENTWESSCNDKCPICGKEIEPYQSEELEN